MFRSGAARLGERNGNNNISIDGENDIVAVLRRINSGPSLNDLVGKMLVSIETPTQKGRARRITSPYAPT
jgi:hypothetical protein